MTPGVGTYRLNEHLSMSKVDRAKFTVNVEHPSTIGSNQGSPRNSYSPRARSIESQKSARDYICGTSRHQRSKIYVKAIEGDFVGRGVPGPGSYNNDIQHLY